MWFSLIVSKLEFIRYIIMKNYKIDFLGAFLINILTAVNL